MNSKNNGMFYALKNLPAFQGAAQAHAVQTLRDCQAMTDGAKRLDCGGSPPLFVCLRLRAALLD